MSSIAAASLSATTRDPFMPRRPAGMRAGLVLALIAHALLIVGLAFSIDWHSTEPAAVEAELWSAVPQSAAPRAVAPEAPQPPPRPSTRQPEPPPATRPQPVQPPAPPPPVDPQIAVEKSRQAQAQKELAEQEQARRDKARRDQARQDELDRREAERERQQQRQAKDQQTKDQQAKDQQAKEEQARKKLLADKAEKAEKDARAAAAQQAAARAALLKRIEGLAGASGDSGSTGTALKSSGPSSGYAGRIAARIKPNIVYPDAVEGNPAALVELKVAPDGTITSRRLMQSSGVKAWDDAVLRAIDRTDGLPRDIDGRVQPIMQIAFKRD